MHHDVDLRFAELGRPRIGEGLLPALRVGDEHLEDVDPEFRRRGERVGVFAKVGSDAHVSTIVRPHGPQGQASVEQFLDGDRHAGGDQDAAGGLGTGVEVEPFVAAAGTVVDGGEQRCSRASASLLMM